jgi:hypothetical protein
MGGKPALRATVIVGLLTVLCPAQVALGQQAPSGVGGIATPDPIPTEDTLDTTYGLAMGSGARAGAIGVSALAYNTSNMAAVSTYDIEAFSQIIPGSKSNGAGDTAAGTGARVLGFKRFRSLASVPPSAGRS